MRFPGGCGRVAARAGELAHADASAWTAAWLTARGRGMVGPRELPRRRDWRGELRWRERGEARKRGHRPDLGGCLPDGTVLPIEVELTEKSLARLDSVLLLHAQWVSAGISPSVMYVCATEGSPSESGRAAKTPD